MSFIKVLFSSYTGFVAADWLSDKYFKKHNRLDYGFLNQFLGRRTESEWWGTRLEHNLTLPAYMAVTGLISSKFWQSYARRRNTTFSIKGTPLAYLFHCYAFVHSGIVLYVAHNAYFNPSVEDKKKYILDALAPTSLGSVTMLAYPFTASALGKIATSLPVLRWVLMGAIAGAIHFAGVKGIGFGDHVVPDSLTEIEREWNDCTKPDDEL